MTDKNECAPRKHDYEFKGNKTFKSMTMTATSTRVRMSVNAIRLFLRATDTRDLQELANQLLELRRKS